MDDFLARDPRIEDYWRGIVLFGRNVASYKFALAKTLLDLNPQSGQLLKLSDLAPVFAAHVSTHLNLADKQATSPSSCFLDACRRYNNGDISKDQLVEQTVKLGFANVIDAFHVVNQGNIPKRFFIDERGTNSGIRITDEFSSLVAQTRIETLHDEVESRWRLVETAWELGIGRDLIGIEHDLETEQLFSINRAMRRKAVTSSKSALNGYQKGVCFYCFADIMQTDKAADTEVDHFFPHVLKQAGFGTAVDGVWNLVLSCPLCNRGPGGKSARIPSVRLLERLRKRNEFLISSHHPLRETLIQQTGNDFDSRKRYLEDFYQRALTTLIHPWEAEECRAPLM